MGDAVDLDEEVRRARRERDLVGLVTDDHAPIELAEVVDVDVEVCAVDADAVLTGAEVSTTAR